MFKNLRISLLITLSIFLVSCNSDNITPVQENILVDNAPNAPSMQQGWTLAGYTEYNDNRDIRYWIETEEENGKVTSIKIKGRGDAFGLNPWTFAKYQAKGKRDQNWERLYYPLESGFTYEDGFRTHKDAWASLKGKVLATDDGAIDVTYEHVHGYSILYYPGDWEGVNMRWKITDPEDNNVKNTPWNYEALQ